MKYWNSKKHPQGNRQGIKVFYYGQGWMNGCMIPPGASYLFLVNAVLASVGDDKP